VCVALDDEEIAAGIEADLVRSGKCRGERRPAVAGVRFLSVPGNGREPPGGEIEPPRAPVSTSQKYQAPSSGPTTMPYGLLTSACAASEASC
jgi:hypothetical protein